MREFTTSGKLRPLSQERVESKTLTRVLCFSPDGRHLLGESDDTPLLWEVVTGNLVRKYDHHRSVAVAAFCRSGEHFVCGAGGDLRLWEMESGKEVRRFGHGWFKKRHPRGLAGLAVSSGDNLVYSCTSTFASDGSPQGVDLWIWDILSGREQRHFRCGSWVNDAVFSWDARLFLGLSDETALVWEVESGREVCRLGGHETQVFSGGFSPDGRRVLTGTGKKGQGYPAPPLNCFLRVWDIENHREELRIEEDAEVFGTAFFPDGNRVFTRCNGDKERTVRIWDIRTGLELQRYSTSVAIDRVTVSPDGQCVAIGTLDNIVRLWEL